MIARKILMILCAIGKSLGCQRRTTGNAYRFSCSFCFITSGRKVRGAVFAQVDRTFDLVSRQGAGEKIRDMIPWPPCDASQLYQAALEGACHVLGRKIPCMCALQPVAVLFKIDTVLAGAAEELDDQVPASTDIACRRFGRGILYW